MLKHKVSYSVMECRSINNSIDAVNIYEFQTLIIATLWSLVEEGNF